jgi:Organic radical activating enzymes
LDKPHPQRSVCILPARLYRGSFSAGRRPQGAGKSAGAAALRAHFKGLYPNKTVWCYSGYTWEQLTGKEPSLARCEATDELLSLLDVLVDGEFVQAKHDISLRFRGSSNQRLLDVKKTLAAGQPVWWEDEKVFATHTMEK